MAVVRLDHIVRFAFVLIISVVAAISVRAQTSEGAIERIYTLPFLDKYTLTCPWGPYSACGLPQLGQHNGTDYSLGPNTLPGERVVAAAGGTVWHWDDFNSQGQGLGCGYAIVIAHGNGHRTRYCHLQERVAANGSSVVRGQLIGYEGGSAAPDGAVNLHFDTRHQGTNDSNCCSGISVDPYAGPNSPGTYMWRRHPEPAYVGGRDAQKVSNSDITTSSPPQRDDAIAFYQDSGTWYLAPAASGFFGPHTAWASGHGIGSHRQFTGDVNGDGKTDSVIFQRAEGRWFVSLSNGSSTYQPTNPWEWASGHGMGSTNQFLMDVTNDGKADAVVFIPDTGHWHVYRSTGTNFIPWPGPGNDLWINGHGQGSNDQLMGDVNGDGRADAVVFFDSNGTWYVALAKPSSNGFYDATLWAASHGQGSDRRFVADVTGGGKADAVTFVGHNGAWYVAPSNGVNLFTPIPNPNQFWRLGHGIGSDNQMVGDVSGDAPSRADAIVYFGTSNGNWYVAVSNGLAFMTPSLWKASYGNGS